MSTGINVFDNALKVDKPWEFKKTQTGKVKTLEEIDNESVKAESESKSDFFFSTVAPQEQENPQNGTLTTKELAVDRKNMREVETYSKDGKQQPIHAPSGGVNSLINRFSVFTYTGCNTANDFKDINDSGPFRKFHSSSKNSNGETVGTGGRNLTFESILTDFDPASKDNISKPYYAADFLYNTWHRKVPLNRLITLRRFLYPTYDNLKFGKDFRPDYKPIAQATTYFGDPVGNKLSEIFKFTGSIKWEELTADVHDVSGNEQGLDSTPFIGGTGATGGLFSNFAGNGGDPSGRKQEESNFQKEFYGADHYFQNTNKILGPVNVINKTKTRGRGIEAGIGALELTFNYKLRSYNGINPRLAMIDIICNLLALSYNNAKFWGGMNRYFPNHPQFEFFGDEKAFYEGHYGEYMDSVFAKMGNGFGKGLDVIKSLIGGILRGDFSSAIEALKGGAAAVMDIKSAKSRPKAIGFKALLTGLPVGEWHLCVGNPYHPIMMMGNLVCTGFEFHLGDELGVDDFPTELTYKIKLEQGRPRDSGDVQSIFNQGEGRIYLPPRGLIDVGNTSASTTNSPSTYGPVLNQPANFVMANNSKADSKEHEQSSGEQGFQFAQKLIGSIY